jgi:hypothetical protein
MGRIRISFFFDRGFLQRLFFVDIGGLPLNTHRFAQTLELQNPDGCECLPDNNALYAFFVLGVTHGLSLQTI